MADITEYRLNNGLRVLLLPDGSMRAVISTLAAPTPNSAINTPAGDSHIPAIPQILVCHRVETGDR